MVHKLLYLNGLAILSVVLFHTAGTGFTAMFAWGHRYLPETVPVMSQVGSLSYYGLRLFEQLSVFSIPAFLFVSGYFIAITTGSRATIDWRAVFSRSRSLIVPYLIWTSIAVSLLAIQGLRFGMLDFVRMYLTGSANPVFYFVPLLLQFYLLAPFIVRLVRNNWKLLLLITGLVQIVVHGLQYPLFLGADTQNAAQFSAYIPKWLFLSRIFWFPFGIVVGSNTRIFISWLERYRLWLFSLVLVLIPLGMLEWELFYQWSGEQWLGHRETFIDSFYSLAVIFAVLSINVKQLPWLNGLRLLGTKSFGIYLVHSLVIEFIARIIYHISPQILGYQVIFQPMLFVAGLGIPLLVMLLVDRSQVRRGYAYLFG